MREQVWGFRCCASNMFAYIHVCIYFIFHPPKNHMWCDANKWVHLICSPDCFHSHLLPYCFVLTRKVAIKISNTHFPSQVCLPTPSIIWHPHTHPHNANEERTYEKIKFMIKGVGFLYSAVFFFVYGGQSTNRNSNFNVESRPDSTQHSRICLERFEYKCGIVKTFRV